MLTAKVHREGGVISRRLFTRETRSEKGGVHQIRGSACSILGNAVDAERSCESQGFGDSKSFNLLLCTVTNQKAYSRSLSLVTGNSRSVIQFFKNVCGVLPICL